MSGTSGDGIDAVLVAFEGDSIHILETLFTPFQAALKTKFTSLFTPGDNEIDRMGEADNLLGQAYLKSVKDLLAKSGTATNDIKAIGLHGQTIRHRPETTCPFTLQIGNPYYITHQLGIPVVNDFRRADMVLQGQGAPLAPLFHQALFSSQENNRAIINTGGIANISYLGKDGSLSGFDTGPANCLMDTWINKHKKVGFDHNGDWASTGEIIESLLDSWLADPYFIKEPPKSTGREHFTLSRINPNDELEKFAPQDVQRSLCELTARSVAQALANFCPKTDQIFVCGGGAHNRLLMARLEAICQLPVKSTESLGVAPDWVESVGFAWLAQACITGTTVATGQITGASAPCILGAIHPSPLR